MKKKSILIAIFAFLTLTVNGFAKTKQNVVFKSFRHFGEIIDSVILKNNLVIFSSRDYITTILKQKKLPKTIYWVLPVDELKPEDANMFVEHLKSLFELKEVSLTAEGLKINVFDCEIYVLLYENIGMINPEVDFAILDVDYFFRSFKNEVKTPKAESVVSVFNSFNEFEWKIKNVFLIRSLDINLPDYVQEYSYLVERIFKSWKENVYPKEVLALDYVDQGLFYFAQYDDAYKILKEIEKFHKDNPYFYTRLFWASLKNYKDDDVLLSAKKAYELDRANIELFLEGADYLIEKSEFYPAYVLVNEGLSLEPWNKKLKDKLKSVVFFRI